MFLAAIKAGLYVLAVLGVLASVVGAYYYLRIVKVMYFDEPAPAFAPMNGELRLILALSGLFVLLFVVYPGTAGRCRRSGGEIAILDEMQLDPAAAAAGVRLIARDTLASTNAEALARARAGERGPLWIVGAEADRRARPARPALDIGAGQSLRDAAAV